MYMASCNKNPVCAYMCFTCISKKRLQFLASINVLKQQKWIVYLLDSNLGKLQRNSIKYLEEWSEI